MLRGLIIAVSVKIVKQHLVAGCHIIRNARHNPRSRIERDQPSAARVKDQRAVRRDDGSDVARQRQQTRTIQHTLCFAQFLIDPPHIAFLCHGIHVRPDYDQLWCSIRKLLDRSIPAQRAVGPQRDEPPIDTVVRDHDTATRRDNDTSAMIACPIERLQQLKRWTQAIQSSRRIDDEVIDRSSQLPA